MTTLAAPLGVFAPHPGRRARRGPVRQAITVVHVTAAVAASAIVASGLLMAGHPHLPRTAPHCVPWHTCTCRFPGSGRWPGNNRLCLINWGAKPGPVTGAQP